jgi:hypothetical protein
MMFIIVEWTSMLEFCSSTPFADAYATHANNALLFADIET